MFERFTDRARRVVVLAQEEARAHGHDWVGTEHLLLGLLGEGEGVAAKALDSLGIGPDAARQQVREIVGDGNAAPAGRIKFNPPAKKVLELSLREAIQFGHNYIGTEHILLALIREGDGVAARVLVNLGADLGRVRRQVIELLHGYQGLGRRTVMAGPLETEAGVARERREDVRVVVGAIRTRLSALEQRAGKIEQLEAEVQRLRDLLREHGIAADPDDKTG